MKIILILSIIISSISIHTNCFATRDIPVNSLGQLKTAISNAVAGDCIVLSDGIYSTDGTITISAKGTALMPITIAAQTIGGVTLSGEGGFVLTGNSAHVIIKGFVFTHKGGTAVIESTAKHCSFTRNIFECTGKPEETLEYLKLERDSNFVSYNTMVNCTSAYVVRNDKSGYGAENTAFVNNIIYGGGAVKAENNKLPIWGGNILWKTEAGSIPESGYTFADPLFRNDTNGIPHIKIQEEVD